jgi:hypothetical protein
MPGHDIHKIYSKLFKIPTSKTDDLMDYAANNPVWHYVKGKDGKMELIYGAMGPDHRTWGHDLATAITAGIVSGEGAQAGIMHLLVDGTYDMMMEAAGMKQKPKKKSQAQITLEILKKILS